MTPQVLHFLGEQASWSHSQPAAADSRIQICAVPRVLEASSCSVPTSTRDGLPPKATCYFPGLSAVSECERPRTFKGNTAPNLRLFPTLSLYLLRCFLSWGVQNPTKACHTVESLNASSSPQLISPLCLTGIGPLKS